jgi:hypothetical protein
VFGEISGTHGKIAIFTIVALKGRDAHDLVAFVYHRTAAIAGADSRVDLDIVSIVPYSRNDATRDRASEVKRITVDVYLVALLEGFAG